MVAWPVMATAGRRCARRACHGRGACRWAGRCHRDWTAGTARGKPPAWYWLSRAPAPRRSGARRPPARPGGNSCGWNSSAWWRRKAPVDVGGQGIVPRHRARRTPIDARAQVRRRPGCRCESGGTVAAAMEGVARTAMLLRADVAHAGWAFEAADRFRQQLLGQPQHDVREQDAERDRGEEHEVKRQRAHMARPKPTSKYLLAISSDRP